MHALAWRLRSHVLGHRLPANRSRIHKVDRARNIKPCWTLIDALELQVDNAKHHLRYLQEAALSINAQEYAW
jgi:hypothetical protein